jgi:hypothetical protein
MAFYKNDNNCLIWSEGSVFTETTELLESNKNFYKYPVEGWVWSDTDLEAKLALKCYGTQPFSSWVFNIETAEWNAPTPIPSENNKVFAWDEPTLSWLEVALDLS